MGIRHGYSSVYGRARINGQLSTQHKIVVGRFAMVAPGDDVAGRQRENACLYVRCFENRLDVLNGIIALTLLYISSQGHGSG
jgi:hypothetical protein